jgi:hypothetical protein
MELRVKRILSIGAQRTLGDMFIDDIWACYTCEDMVRPDGVKIDGATAIPYGTYPVIIDESTRFKRPMPHILNVKGFSGIRIHKGNNELQTEGCILVGMSRGMNSIWDCQPAFDKVYGAIEACLKRGETCTIKIE